MTQIEDERTTALGLFHFGHSYASAAISLMRNNLRSTHADAPVRFLFAHSAELFLKAFLRFQGVSVAQLKSKKMGHNFDSLKENAVRPGLTLSDEDNNVLSTMNDAVYDRYIVTGMRSVVSVERAKQLCQHLNSEIGPKIYLGAGLSRSAPNL